MPLYKLTFLTFSKCKVTESIENLNSKKPTLSDSFCYFWRWYEGQLGQLFEWQELYGIVWQEISHLWELYDKQFWSTGISKKR